jgi:hypothetical protein
MRRIFIFGMVLVTLVLIGCTDYIAIDEQDKITYIDTSARMKNFDADSEIDGVDVMIHAKDENDKYYYIPKESKVYVKITKDDFVLKEWNGDIGEAGFQSYHVKVHFDKEKINQSFFEIISVLKVETTVTLPNGNSFSDTDSVFT